MNHGSQCGPSVLGSRLNADHPKKGVLLACRFTLVFIKHRPARRLSIFKIVFILKCRKEVMYFRWAEIGTIDHKRRLPVREVWGSSLYGRYNGGFNVSPICICP